MPEMRFTTQEKEITKSMARFDDQGSYIPPTDREAYSKGKKWLIIGLVGIVLLPFIIWGLSVAFSGIAGRGNAEKKINRADNRIFAQEQFRELYNDIQAYDQQITTTKSTASAETDPTEKSRLNSVVLGVTNQCISTVKQYNAEATKVSKQRFLDAGLPSEIDTSSPNFDCKGE